MFGAAEVSEERKRKERERGIGKEKKKGKGAMHTLYLTLQKSLESSSVLDLLLTPKGEDRGKERRRRKGGINEEERERRRRRGQEERKERYVHCIWWCRIA